MKKISFSSIKGMLSRDEMRQVKGGSGGSCGYRVGTTVLCGISRNAAQTVARSMGGWWCCTRCASNGGDASYC